MKLNYRNEKYSNRNSKKSIHRMVSVVEWRWHINKSAKYKADQYNLPNLKQQRENILKKIERDSGAYGRRQWHPTPVFFPGKSHGWRSLVGVVHGVAKTWTRLSDFTFTFHFHALEKEIATDSSVLAWRIPGTGEPGGLLSMGSHRVGHDWSNLAAAAESPLII